MATLACVPNKNVQIRQYPLKTGETFVTGDAVMLHTDGTVKACAANPTAILGFALSDYSGALDVDIYGGDVPVAVAEPGSTFILKASGAVTDANVGVNYGITITSGSTAVNLGEESNTCFIVHRAIPAAESGEDHMVEVSIESGTLQLYQGA